MSEQREPEWHVSLDEQRNKSYSDLVISLSTEATTSST